MFDGEDVEAQVMAANEDRLSTAEWGARNGVDPSAFAMLVAVFGKHPVPGDVAITCFRLGWQGREEGEPRGAVDPCMASDRFSVQHAIVDTRDGSIVSVHSDPARAAQLAGVLGDGEKSA